MAVITMPTGGIARISWTNPVHPDYAVTSRWTGKTQMVDIGATEGFRAQIEIVPGKEAHLLAWRAWFAKMRGRTNTAYVDATGATASVLGAVNGANQTGYSINIDGLPNSTTVKRAGELVHMATSSADWRMFILTADLVSNGSGQAAASIEPNIAVAYPDNAAFQYGTVQCHMRLVSPVTGWGHDPGGIYRPFSFEMEEVI